MSILMSPKRKLACGHLPCTTEPSNVSSQGRRTVLSAEKRRSDNLLDRSIVCPMVIAFLAVKSYHREKLKTRSLKTIHYRTHFSRKTLSRLGA